MLKEDKVYGGRGKDFFIFWWAAGRNTDFTSLWTGSRMKGQKSFSLIGWGAGEGR